MAGKVRSRAEITDKLAVFPPAVQGKICSCTKVRKSGKEVTYHNLQYQMNGKHHTIFIPEDRLPEFEAAMENGKIAKEPLYELSDASAEEIVTEGDPLKKSSAQPQTTSRRA